MESPNTLEKRGSVKNKAEGFNHEQSTRPDEEFNRLDQLPSEVLEKILSYLTFNDRKNIRLVCYSLYEACSRNEHVHIQNENQWEEFWHCGLSNMNVTVDSMAMKWDPVVWEKVGARIRTLHMNTCVLGDRTVRNIITFCENLRTLRLTLKNGNAEKFCLPDTLQQMGVARTNLEILIIQRKSIERNSPCSHRAWTDIFNALLRIFPTVRHITSGWSIPDTPVPFFSFSCSVEPDFNDLSGLSPGLALMLSGGEANWDHALDVFSTLRFSAVSLVYSQHRRHRQRPEWEHLLTAGSEFFEKLAALKVKWSSGVNFIANREHAFERSVIQRIARHWDSLRALNFDRTGLGPRVSHKVDPICCQSRIELSSLKSESSNTNEALLDICISRGRPSLYVRWEHESSTLDIYPRDFLKRHEFIEHLTLTTDVSDKMLQTIFQFMINLKSFSISLGRHNTCAGFGLVCSAGMSPGCSIVTGYSIKRLQRLKRLTIFTDEFSFEDCIYEEFDFPKLNELEFPPPKELTTLQNLILRLPALKSLIIRDTQDVSSFLDVICPSVKGDFIIISFPDATVTLNEAVVKKFFESYPCLSNLHIDDHFYWYGNGKLWYDV